MKALTFALLMLASPAIWAQTPCVPTTAKACSYEWTLSWNASEGATKYQYEWKIEGKGYSGVKDIAKSPATFTQAIKVNEKLVVRARACNAQACSDFAYVNFVFKGLPPDKVTGLRLRRL